MTGTTTSRTDEQLAEQARTIGAEHGRSAATWVIDGNTSKETCLRLIKWDEDGDPQLDDHIPSPDLGGEWADSYTERDLLKELGVDDDESGDLCDAYVEAYAAAASAGVIRAARAQVA